MTKNFVADADFLTGLLADRDSRNEESKSIFGYLRDNELISNIYDFHVSNYIIMEVMHNLQGKNVPFKEILENYKKLQQCHVFHIKNKEIEEAFSTKLAPYCNHRTHNPPIGIVDATSLVVMDKKRIIYIISFDEGFDRLPDRFFTRVKDNEVIDQKILAQYK